MSMIYVKLPEGPLAMVGFHAGLIHRKRSHARMHPPFQGNFEQPCYTLNNYPFTPLLNVLMDC